MKLKITFQLIILSLVIIFSTNSANASYNSFTATDDFILKNIKIENSATTTDITVFKDSQAEKLRIDNGVAQVFLQSGSLLKIGSADSSVQSIAYYNISQEYCTDNTTPGTTQVDVFSYGYTEYYLKLQSSVCSATSTTPTSVTINKTYDVSSGATTTTITQGTTEIETIEIGTSSNDGTVSTKELTTTKVNNAVSEVSLKTTINTIASPTDTQEINLTGDSSASVSEMQIDLPSQVMQDITSQFGSGKDVVVETYYKDVSSSQSAGTGQVIVDSKVFSIDINVSGTAVTTFSTPIVLTFDITNVTDRNNLVVSWFDTSNSTWTNLTSSITGNTITASVDHLTDFAITIEEEEEEETTTQTTSSGGGGGNSSWIIATPSNDTETTETVATSTQLETIEKTEDKQITTVNSDTQLAQILVDSDIVFESGTELDKIVKHNNAVKDVEAQKNGMNKYTTPMVDGFNLTINQIYAINNFIVYGTKGTQILGAGERAGVVNSYKKAFNKLPKTKEEWQDAIKIGNGRWPSERSEVAEAKANIEFTEIYKKQANMKNPNDNAAVTVMAYGLRPANRNLSSEKVAIKTFKYIYTYNPKSALDWDIVRAIAYSGATR